MHLEIMEKTLGKQCGFFTKFLRPDPSAARGSPTVEAFRKQQATNCADRYRLHYDHVGAKLRAEWAAMFMFRLGLAELGRVTKGSNTWRLKAPEETLAKRRWYCESGELLSPTAAQQWAEVSAFLGWVANRSDAKEFVARDDLSLALLAVPELVQQYVAFRLSRSANRSWAAARGIARTVKWLTGGKHAWLKNHPELIEEVPARLLKGRDWIALCDEAHTTCENILDRAASAKNSRPVKDKFNPLLTEESIEFWIDKMLQFLRDEAARWPEGHVRAAVAHRDFALVLLLWSLPLRAETVATLRLSPGASLGYIERTKGHYRVVSSNTKNSRSIDVVLPDGLTPVFDRYINHDRRILVAGKVDAGYVFPSLRFADRPWQSISESFARITAMAFPETAGIRMHAMRHLACTSLFRKGKSVTLAAALLNVTEGTARKAYVCDDPIQAAVDQHGAGLRDLLARVEGAEV